MDYVFLRRGSFFTEAPEALMRFTTITACYFSRGWVKMTCFVSLSFERSLVQTRLHRRCRQLEQELHRVDAEIRDLQTQLRSDCAAGEHFRRLEFCLRRTNKYGVCRKTIGT